MAGSGAVLTCQCRTNGGASVVQLGGVLAPFIDLPVTGAHLARPVVYSTRAYKPPCLLIYVYIACIT